MGIKHEGRDAERKNGHPEVDQVRGPQRQRDIKQRDQGPHAEIDTWPCKPREQYAEVYPRGRKPASGGNVPSAAKCQIAQD